MKTSEPSRTRRRLPLENLGKHLHADEQQLQRFRDENDSACWSREKPSVAGAHTSWEGPDSQYSGLAGHTVSVATTQCCHDGTKMTMDRCPE